MDDIFSSILSPGTFNQMLRSATPVALAALGGAMTEHAGIMNIGMDGMILMVLAMGVLVGLFFALLTVQFRSDEFIIGTALNTFALGLTSFLSRSIFGTAGTKGNPALPTIHIPLLDRVPFLGAVFNDNRRK